MASDQFHIPWLEASKGNPQLCVGENAIFESGLGVAQLQLHCKVKTIDIIRLAKTQGHIIVI